MSSLIFLVAFVVLSLCGALVLWWRERGPRSMEAQMTAFKRELEALSPESPPDQQMPRRPRSTAHPRARGRRTG